MMEKTMTSNAILTPQDIAVLQCAIYEAISINASQEICEQDQLTRKALRKNQEMYSDVLRKLRIIDGLAWIERNADRRFAEAVKASVERSFSAAG